MIRTQLERISRVDCFYKKKLEGVDISSIRTQEDFERLPFSEKADLRDAYPLGLSVVPEEKIVRIHSS